MIVRCPLCHSVLAESDCSLVCVACDTRYSSLDGYYDLYIASDHSPAASYTPETQHLLYSTDIILSMNHIHGFDLPALSKHWKTWNIALDKLKETVSRAGTSERVRVEFMVDDYTSSEFKNQENFTERKAENIAELLAKIQPDERTVLHVGCGGYANRAIPILYSRMGYQNWGVDVVRSYVREFLEYGEAYLADATALPFGNGIFEVINFTDILEHLFDPLKALQEAGRVLKPNGHIIIDTPNRGFARAENPISAFRFFVEHRIPGLRRPRTITGEWNGEIYFHTEFSRDEIEQLLSQAGFEVRYIAANPPNTHGARRRLSKTVLRRVLTGAGNYDSWFALAQKEAT